MKLYEIVKIDGYNYFLKDSLGNIWRINLDFKGITPKISDCLKLSSRYFEEVNFYTFGVLGDINNLKREEIIELHQDDNIVFLKRYYG